MNPQRRFHRVLLTAKSSLIHREVRHEGLLENASLNGALISFSERVPVDEGDRCVLLVYPDAEEKPLQFIVEVIHTCFTMIGTQFVSMDDETRLRLCQIIEGASGGSIRSNSELDGIRGHVAGYLRPT